MEIVELFDKPRTANGCLLATEHACGDENPVRGASRMARVKRTSLDFLENTTLAALTTRERAVETRDP